MSDKELMSDAYASASSSSTPPTLPEGWAASQEPLLSGAPQPDYLFSENYDASYRRTWGERLTFHAGSAYLAGERLHPPTRPNPWLPRPTGAAARVRRRATQARVPPPSTSHACPPRARTQQPRALPVGASQA